MWGQGTKKQLLSSYSVSLAMVVTSIACLGGCREAPQLAVPRAVAQIPLEEVAKPDKRALVPNLMAPTREVFARYEPATILRILGNLYHETEDPARRAKAVAALYVFARWRCPPELMPFVMAFAREAWTEGNGRTRYLALRILEADRRQREENIRVIIDALDDVTDYDVAYDAYGVLVNWGVTQPAADQLMVLAPADPQSEAYRTWANRTSAALCACGARNDWVVNGLPKRIERRLLELIREDEAFAYPALDILVRCAAPAFAKTLRTEVYNGMQPGRRKILVGAAMTELDPSDDALFTEVLSAIKAMVDNQPALTAEEFPFGWAWSFLLASARKSDDPPKRGRAVWEAFGDTSPCQRSQILKGLLHLDILNPYPRWLLDLVQSTSDEDLRAIFKKELEDADVPSVLSWLEGGQGLLSTRPMMPRRQEALRRAEDIYRSLKRGSSHGLR